MVTIEEIRNDTSVCLVHSPHRNARYGQLNLSTALWSPSIWKLHTRVVKHVFTIYLLRSQFREYSYIQKFIKNAGPIKWRIWRTRYFCKNYVNLPSQNETRKSSILFVDTSRIFEKNMWVSGLVNLRSGTGIKCSYSSLSTLINIFRSLDNIKLTYLCRLLE